MLYRSSLFLPAKYQISETRPVNNAWTKGYVTGCLGQNHLDTLEGLLLSQNHMTTNDEGTQITGIVVDPYKMKKNIKKTSYTYLNKYLKDMKDCNVKVKFNFGNGQFIETNGPIIKSIETFEEIYCPKIKANRKILKVIFSDWFVQLWLIPPYSNYLKVFYDEKDPIKRAVRRFLSSHDGKMKLSVDFILNSLQIPHISENIEIIENEQTRVQMK